MKHLKPIIDTNKEGELIEVYFNITIVIDKDNYARIVDDRTEDWKDIVDCNTLSVTHHKITVG